MLASKLLLTFGFVAAAAFVYVTNQSEAPASVGGQDTATAAPEIASWPTRIYNTGHVNNWSLIGQWEDVEGSTTEGLKRAIGDGPHSISIMVDIEAEARVHGLNTGSIVGLWGTRSLRIENNDTADPFSPGWIGVENHWELYGWGQSTPSSPTTYNWDFVVSHTPDSASCWQTAVAVPTGTSPGALDFQPPDVGPGDKYRVCGKENANNKCKLTVELSTGRCWEHELACGDDGEDTGSGYWHHDVSADELIVTGDRTSVPCEEE